MAAVGRSIRVAVIGAGVSGICAVHHLRTVPGVTCVAFEKAERVGGTWRDNTYPGVACDLPSRYYSFSFGPAHDWTRSLASGSEILTYIEKVVRQLGVDNDIRFGREVETLTWDEPARQWIVEVRGCPPERFDAVVAATGFLRVPRMPDIKALDAFEGPVFHTSRWNHQVPLQDKRLAVVGTGASAIQIVTALAPVARSLVVFQSTPSWILPFRSIGYSRLGRLLYRTVPGLRELHYNANRVLWETLLEGTVHPGITRELLSRACRWHLRAAVHDAGLRQKLTPDYQPLCRRGLLGTDFYRTLARHDVTLVDSPAAAAGRQEIEAENGTVHPADVLVLATGFDAQAYLHPITVRGRQGISLADRWKPGPRSYLSVMVPSFPNFFMMQGPYSPSGNQSSIAAAEIQAKYIAECLRALHRGQADVLEPTEDATDTFLRHTRSALPRTVWASGCHSYYLGPDGTPVVWPWNARAYRRRLRRPRLPDLVPEN
ncbi:flavin-containing monooxygenase [Streptomyces murinus]